VNSTPALSVSDLVVGYGGPPVIRDVSLDVMPREFLAVLGASGSGKTTLLRSIAGYLKPTAGTISVAGEIVAGPHTWVPPEKRRIGVVPQEGALFPHLDVASNIAFGLPRDKRRAKQRVAQMLEMVNLEGLGNARPHELSGGQQQRVALARALAPEPAAILLDEPFSSLDAALRTEVRTEVRALLSEVGTTTILVTHDQEEALSLADRVAVMARGRIQQIGEPWAIYETPASLDVARFIGDLVELPVISLDGSTAHTPLGPVNLGPVNLAADSDTAVDVVDSRVALRPEQLVLVADRSVAAGGEELNPGSRGVVQSISYHGHDSLTTVQLEDGTPIAVRSAGGSGVAPGDVVRVKVTGSGRLFNHPVV
jgi:iron(III) transport system ATP-binding protein